MITIRGFVLITFLFISFISFGKDHQIQVDTASHTLVAPEGQQYQWYFNGHKLAGANNKSIKVIESGSYKVELVDETGSNVSTNASVVVTAAGEIIRIWLLGDSTVSNYNATNQYPMAGWGQEIGKFFEEANIQVNNKAVGGRSSRSYYSGPSAIWPGFKDQIKSGDYAFIQFGHNDASSVPERYTSVPDYKIYLKKYIDELRAKGAFPVLVTPMVQNYWTNGTMQRSLLNYATAMMEVATAQKVPLVNLNLMSYNYYKNLGKDYITRFFYNTYVAGEYPSPSDFSGGNINNGKNGDGTHFQVMGAIANARFIIQGLKDLTTDPVVSKISKYIKPQYQVAVSVNPAGSDIGTTLTNTYPEGLTITLKTLPKANGTFVKWVDASGNTISTKTLVTTVVTHSTPTSYTAIYKGAIACNASISTTDPTTICQGGSTLLTAANGTSYIWKNGNTQVGTSKTYKASSSGAYTVEVTDYKGCKATSTVTEVKVSDTGTWYGDADKDGMGDSTDVKKDCVKPEGYVAVKGDLCPLDAGKTLPGACGCGQKETSNCTLAVEDQYETNTFSAYPNPFQGEMFIVDNSSFNYRILSVAGQELENGHINNTGSIGGKLLPGIYILEIIKESGIKQIKISKK